MVYIYFHNRLVVLVRWSRRGEPSDAEIKEARYVYGICKAAVYMTAEQLRIFYSLSECRELKAASCGPWWMNIAFWKEY